jgi:hypothetical protein
MIRASNWRSLERNTLQGFLTLHLEPRGLTIHKCTYHRSASGSRRSAERVCAGYAPLGRLQGHQLHPRDRWQVPSPLVPTRIRRKGRKRLLRRPTPSAAEGCSWRFLRLRGAVC